MPRARAAAAALFALAALAAAAAEDAAAVPPWMAASGRHSPHPRDCAAGEVFVSAEVW